MPITVTVEDGSGKTDANSYVSVADATAILALDPHVTNWPAALTADQKSQYVIKATALIDAHFDFRGRRVWKEQALAWPRSGAQDNDGVEILENEMPAVLAKAAATLASLIIEENPEAVDDTRGFTRIKADTVELDIDPNDRKPVMPDQISAMLRSIGSRKGSTVRKLVRA
jgi:hypothetical protein